MPALKAAVIRVQPTIDDAGLVWYSAVIDIGARHLEPPIATRTIGGLMTFLSDVLLEELESHQRPTDPGMPPVTP